MEHLARCGPLPAATWFTLTGAEVSWPLEPCRYDLIVTESQDSRRIQVKTTTTRSGTSYQVNLRCISSRKEPYAPEDLDAFFVVDAAMTMYLIPVGVVAGRTGISLNAYQAYQLPPLALAA